MTQRHFDQGPGLYESADPATRDYVFNQTMLRIKNPQRSLFRTALGAVQLLHHAIIVQDAAGTSGNSTVIELGAALAAPINF